MKGTHGLRISKAAPWPQSVEWPRGNALRTANTSQLEPELAQPGGPWSIGSAQQILHTQCLGQAAVKTVRRPVNLRIV